MSDHDEFSVIDQLFKPLAGLSRESRGLMDDVAVIPADGAHDIVVTTDAMVAGVHFFENDPLDLVARKLMRVNVSDLIAKGAKPYGYQLMTAWPRGISMAEKADFARGLQLEQQRFGIDLFGGDTVSTEGPLVVSLTAFGRCAPGRALSRIGAKPGHNVLVSGYIGQGYLGLRALQGTLPPLSLEDTNDLISAYHLPELKCDAAQALSGAASASMDVSDGLLADADHMARASGVQIRIDLNRVPTSVAARAAIAGGVNPIDLMTGGDDYQILCTADEAGTRILLGAGFSVIGSCDGVSDVTPAGVQLWADGRHIEVASKGFRHQI
jgi:thiamine-monophosphate kinase